MSLLTLQSTPAERMIGCKFSESFETAEKVLQNGGVVNGTIPISGGKATFDSTADYILYTGELTQFSSFTIVADIDVEPFISGSHQTICSNRDGGGAHFEVGISNDASTTAKALYYFDGTVVNSSTATVGAGRIRVVYTYDGAGNTIFYADGAKLGATVAGTTIGTVKDTLYVGRPHVGASSLGGDLYDLKIYKNKVFTAQEVADEFDNSTYNYRNQAALDLTLTAENHDPTNVRALDVSGNANHATFGDGSTSSTYPAKLQKRGYDFDGGDYLDSTITLSGTYTIAALVNRNASTSYLADFRASGGTGFLWYQTNASLNSSSGTDYINAVQTSTMPTNGAVSIIVTGMTLASTQLIVGAHNGLASYMTDDLLSFSILEGTLTPLQVADLHINMFNSINQT